MSELPEGVEYVDMTDAVLHIEPGDYLVARCHGELDAEARESIRESIASQLEIEVNVILIPANIELSVVRQIDRHRDCVTRTELEKMLAPETG